MKAFAGDAGFKARGALAGDPPADLTDAARRMDLPAWWAHLARALQAGLDPAPAAIFPAAAIEAVAPGADLDGVREKFIVLGLTCALGLMPEMEQARRLRTLRGPGDRESKKWRDDQARLGASLRRMVRIREVELRRTERNVARASNLVMRAAAEKILAGKVIACEAARAAARASEIDAETAARMVAPLAAAVAARTWLEVIGRIKVENRQFRGGTGERIAATQAAWARITDLDMARAGRAGAHAFLAAAFLDLTRGARSLANGATPGNRPAWVIGS